MFRATLLVINGANRGSRYEISSALDVVIGRSVGCNLRLDDSEVSRHHARITHNGTDFVLNDLKSANGTKVNGQPVAERALGNGDSLQFGSSVIAFQLTESHHPPVVSANQIRFIEDGRPLDSSVFAQTVGVNGVDAMPLQGAPKSGLELLYHVAEELVTPVHSLEELLQKILDLTMNAVNADRGCVLLKDPVGVDLTAIAFSRGKSPTSDAQQMPVSRSITDYVLHHGTAVRTSDASLDNRFQTGQSIVTAGIREAICAPMRGRSDLLGVFYLDTTTPYDQAMSTGVPMRLNDEHLRTVITVARQAALALESRQFQDAMLKAERFAAMGQTITVLSHHIKNILQGVRGGSYLIRMGLDKEQTDLIRQGSDIVERNQTRIYDLVMDMLSFSKDRVPSLQLVDLNKVIGEVSQLAAARAAECGVAIEFRKGDDIPTSLFDAEGIHRAVLNIVSNAIDAVEGTENGAVVLQTGYDKSADMLLVAVSDNGPGIPEDQRNAIFNVFESSKGARGTGIGLPVSRKILREHGGRVRVEGGPGQGTRFVLSWPRGNVTLQDIGDLIPREDPISRPTST
ncbi:MAG: ATP-binding protein [Planctomycetales bacterium]|nr:ATP-binding protein [Planctomycetales bacterium]